MARTKKLSDLDQRVLRYGDLKPFLVALSAQMQGIEQRLTALESKSTPSEPAVAPTEGA